MFLLLVLLFMLLWLMRWIQLRLQCFRLWFQRLRWVVSPFAWLLQRLLLRRWRLWRQLRLMMLLLKQPLLLLDQEKVHLVHFLLGEVLRLLRLPWLLLLLLLLTLLLQLR